MVTVQIGLVDPTVVVQARAEEDSLPVLRQVLRALGDSVAARREPLEDAELALTEACANVVAHAYPDGAGEVEVTIVVADTDLRLRVRDFGRGMPAADQEAATGRRGHGLVMIDGIAHELEILGNGGTEVGMTIDMGEPMATAVDGATPDVQPAERIVRRLVAVVAAQADMPVDRTLEALLVAEMVVRGALPRLVGERMEVAVEQTPEGIGLRLGPLEQDAAEATVRDSDVPAIGPVIARLADDVETERGELDGRGVEYLRLHVGARKPAAKA